MAITIKSNKETFKHENVPATQGNVLNTINTYNDELKKKYYDKEQTRADVNKLQGDIIKLIKQLAGNIALENFEEKSANTESEDGDSDRIESYNGDFNESKELNYDESGLIQKLSIIANLVSGNIDTPKMWDKGSTGNLVGEEKSTIATPVIGYTRRLSDEHKYTATIDIGEDRKSHLKVGGLNTVKGEDGDDKEISDQTVLSEKQTAELIEACMVTILGDYDTQLANLIGYLLFNSDDLPESYQYVLRHINEPYIGSAPLFAKFDSDKLVVHCVNSATGYNEQFIVFDDTESQKNGNWNLELDNNFSNIKVSYNDNDTTEFNYNIPVPMVTLEIDHKILVNNEKPVVTVEGTFLGTKLTITQEDVLGDNKLYWNVPCGSKINISTSDLKLYDSNDKPFENATEYKILDNTKLHANVVKYVLKYDNDTDNSCTIEEWYKDDLTLNITLSDYTKTGYASNGTLKGGTITGNDLSINIKEPGLIEDKINWVVKKVTVTHNVEGQEPYTEDLDWFAPLSNPKDVQGKKFTGWKNINGMLVTEVSGDNGENTMTVSTSLEEIKYRCTYVVGDVDVSHDGLFSEHTHDAGKIPTISRTGYTFDGWYTSPNFEGVNKTDNYKNEDATYYAKWIENSYTIKFNLSVPSLAEGANPYFKYGDVKVVTTNMPFTLGRPYATGYTFTGWYLSDAGYNELLNEINVTDFNGGKEITLYAKWEADSVKVLEEIYYQTDSQDGYDLMEVIENTGEPGSSYQTSTYMVMKGFEEDTSKNTGNLSPLKATGNVIKRYFNRCSYQVTFYESKKESDNPNPNQYFVYSDNDIVINEPKSVLSGYTFDSWVDNDRKRFNKIPAYTAENLTLNALYNQNAPVENTHFSIERSSGSIIIKNIRSDKQVYYKQGNDDRVIPQEGFTFDMENYTNKNTVYAYIYFPENSSIYVKGSPLVTIPLKGKPDKPIEGKNNDYLVDPIHGTITSLHDADVPLEISYDGGFNYVDFIGTVDVNDKKFIIRKKENYKYIASDPTDELEITSSKISVSTDQLEILNSLENYDISNMGITYEKSGTIKILNAIFEGNHGPLQYTLGENGGGAWVDITPNGEGTNRFAEIFIDKPNTVFFRYGEDNTHYATAPITNGFKVDYVQHNIHFNIADLPTDEKPTFNGLDGNGNLKVKSGDQLCNVGAYANNVSSWTINGYEQDEDVRKLGFIQVEDKTSNTYVNFNEATIITKDLNLKLSYKPHSWANQTIIEKFQVDFGGGVYKVFDANVVTCDIVYGTPFEQTIFSNITNHVKGQTIIEDITNFIDNNVNYYKKTFNPLSYVVYNSSENNLTWNQQVYTNNWYADEYKLSFSYNDTDEPDVRKATNSFNYRFRPVFTLKNTNSSSDAYSIEFTGSNGLSNANDCIVKAFSVPSINNSGNNVGLVYIVDGNTCDYTDPDTQKTIQIQQLHLYYENDPRVTDEYGIKPEYQPLNSNTQITGITPDVERTMLRVIFHSFFEKVNSGAKYVFHHAEEHYVKIRENDAESPVDTVKVETDGVTINATTDWNIQEK